MDNSELKEKIEIQRLVIDEMQYRCDFERILKQKDSGTPKIAASNITFRAIMLVAWSAAAIFIGLFFVNSAVQNSRMESISTAYYSAPETSVMRGDNMRGEDTVETDFL